MEKIEFVKFPNDIMNENKVLSYKNEEIYICIISTDRKGRRFGLM